MGSSASIKLEGFFVGGDFFFLKQCVRLSSFFPLPTPNPAGSSKKKGNKDTGIETIEVINQNGYC